MPNNKGVSNGHMALNTLIGLASVTLGGMIFSDDFREDVSDLMDFTYDQGAAQVEELTEGLDTYREESRVKAKVDEAKKKNERIPDSNAKPASEEPDKADQALDYEKDNRTVKTDADSKNVDASRSEEKQFENAFHSIFDKATAGEYSSLAAQDRQEDIEEAKKGLKEWSEKFGVKWEGVAGQMLRERGWRDIGADERYKGWGEVSPIALKEAKRMADNYLNEEELDEFSELAEGSLDYNQELNAAAASGYIKVLQETEGYGKFDIDRALQEPLVWDLNEDDDLVFYLSENMTGEEKEMVEKYWEGLPELEDEDGVKRLGKSEMRDYMEENGMPLQHAHILYCWGHAAYGEKLGTESGETLVAQSPYAVETGKLTYQAKEAMEDLAE